MESSRSVLTRQHAAEPNQSDANHTAGNAAVMVAIQTAGEHVCVRLLAGTQTPEPPTNLRCRKTTANRAANSISAPRIIWYTEAVTADQQVGMLVCCQHAARLLSSCCQQTTVT